MAGIPLPTVFDYEHPKVKALLRTYATPEESASVLALPKHKLAQINGRLIQTAAGNRDAINQLRQRHPEVWEIYKRANPAARRIANEEGRVRAETEEGDEPIELPDLGGKGRLRGGGYWKDELGRLLFEAYRIIDRKHRVVMSESQKSRARIDLRRRAEIDEREIIDITKEHPGRGAAAVAMRERVKLRILREFQAFAQDTINAALPFSDWVNELIRRVEGHFAQRNPLAAAPAAAPAPVAAPPDPAIARAAREEAARAAAARAAPRFIEGRIAFPPIPPRKGKGKGRKRGGGFDDVFGTRPGSVPVQVTNDPVQMAKWDAEGNAALAARQAAAQAAIQQKLDDEKREGWKKTFGIMGDVFSSVGGLTKLIPGVGNIVSPVANTIGNLYKLGSGHSDCPCRGGAKEHSAFLRQLRKVGIEPKLYLSKAKSKAKKEGYDPATL